MRTTAITAGLAAFLVLSIACNRKTDVTVSFNQQLAEPPSAPDSGYAFEAPVRIKAGDEFISTEGPGYACPTMADVDGDGNNDLVVGQFNQGHMLFCKNIAASGERPQFAAAQWIQSEGQRAIVPGVW
jgi:hypothetical protein